MTVCFVAAVQSLYLEQQIKFHFLNVSSNYSSATITGIVHSKLNIYSLFTHPQAIQDVGDSFLQWNSKEEFELKPWSLVIHKCKSLLSL